MLTESAVSFQLRSSVAYLSHISPLFYISLYSNDVHNCILTVNMSYVNNFFILEC